MDAMGGMSGMSGMGNSSGFTLRQALKLDGQEYGDSNYGRQSFGERDASYGFLPRQQNSQYF